MHHQKSCPVCGNSALRLHKTVLDYAVSGEEFNLLACDACQLLLTSPRPADEDYTHYYDSRDYISHTGTANSPLDRLYLVARKFTLLRKCKLIARHAGKGRLLDYGCGTGDFLRVATRKGWEATGIEPAPAARNIAARSIKALYPDLDACSQDNFNVISLWHVLEHVADLSGTLEKLKQKLAPNGTIFIAVPNFRSHDSLHYASHWAGLDVPRHLWHFSQHAMTDLLAGHQLRIIKKIPMVLDAYYISLLSEKYMRGNRLSLPGCYHAVRVGFRSNRLARKTSEFSSLIYVVTQ